MIAGHLESSLRISESLLADEIGEKMEIAALLIDRCLRGGCKVMWCGNGGSAAMALHLSAELVGRYKRGRRAAASIALTGDIAAVTAIGNDYGFEHIFTRQIEALARPGDVLVTMSTSGKSQNIVNALLCAETQGLSTIGLSGRAGMARQCTVDLAVPSEDTALIQQAHLAIGHAIIGAVEDSL